ncbi:MAG: carboxynorspermidine decarboxylase [Pseudomonadales bacterium]
MSQRAAENPGAAFSEAVDVVPSPCFLLDEALLRSNLELLDRVQRASGAKIICALKGFAMYSAFPLVRQYLPGVTASSLSEALLGEREFGGEVHAYVPAYVPAEFDEIARIASHVTFNSLSEFGRYRHRLGRASAGLRINPEYAEVETDLYNPCVPGSRLGVTAAQLGGTLPDGIEGLHFHTLCEKGADTLARTLVHVEQKFSTQLRRVRWLNMGGGHAITRRGYDVEHLIALIRGMGERYPNLEQIVLEPGSAVAWETGCLVATVLDVVENAGSRTAMLDTSFAAHMPDTLEMPYRPRVRGAVDALADPDARGHRFNLGGLTCLAGDYMPGYAFSAPIEPGARVVFEDMIHYTMVKTTTFNGVNLPAIAIARETGAVDVIKTFGYEDYRRRL